MMWRGASGSSRFRPRAPHGRGVAVAGWREFGGKRHYYRSKAEMRYGAFLEWRKTRGEVSYWAPEPDVFWFQGIRRGVTSYKPDFKVVLPDGQTEFHEVKGWLDARSRTALKRMSKYYPEVTVRVIDGAWFKANKWLAAIVPGWEA